MHTKEPGQESGLHNVACEERLALSAGLRLTVITF